MEYGSGHVRNENQPWDSIPVELGDTCTDRDIDVARLLVDRLPNGSPLVLMDCGGWIENCTARPAKGPAHVVPSGQIGVQHANEVRLYQIGGNA